MKVLAICGSPRKGNTETMLKEVLRGARDAGAETELVLLREKKINYCTGCEKCKDGDCIFDDDMNEILEKMMKADLIVIGSPNYFSNVPGILKSMIDRTDPLYHQGEKLKGKKAAAVFVGEVETETLKRAVIDFIESCQMELVKSMKAKAGSPDEISKNREKMEECYAFGQEIVKDINKTGK